MHSRKYSEKQENYAEIFEICRIFGEVYFLDLCSARDDVRNSVSGLEIEDRINLYEPFEVRRPFLVAIIKSVPKNEHEIKCTRIMFTGLISEP